MKVSELGEFNLIQLLADIVGGKDSRLLLGIGDDAAAWQGDESVQLCTIDTLVQDVHFRLDTTSWADLGWKALAINISDIAAMGGLPKYAVVSLALPGHTEVDSLTELYRGMKEIAQQFEVSIVGGDVVGAPVLVISLALMGKAQKKGHSHDILTRSAAAPGDLIAVTGYLGASKAGLRMLTQGLKFSQEVTAFLREAHLRPRPRVAEGRVLALCGVKASIDISDGLVADLTKLCQASGVGARVRVEQVPLHPLLKAAFPEEGLKLALSGGEDYELLFTAKEEIMGRVEKLSPSPITLIGEIVGDQPGRVVLLDDKNKAVDWEVGGWEHFTATGSP